MKPFLNIISFKNIQPVEGIKRGYGLLKRHRENKIRPIVSSLNSVTQGAENFLYKIISPLESKCELLVKSTKEFKAKFMEHSPKFDINTHKIVSYDCVQLYTNVNTKMVVDFMLDIIHENTSEFFNEGYNIVDENEILINFPPRRIFKNFINDVLLNFNNFSTINKYYQQIQGLGMGSRLSSIISNLYVWLMEKSLITKHIENGNILFYARYADDILTIIDKNNEPKIFSDINARDPNCLQIKDEYMSNNKLPFLDTRIIINNENHLELKKYRKAISSDYIMTI